MNKLVLIDGNSIAYRAFFALPLLNTDKGVYTNAVYGFTTMLLKVLEEQKPTHLMVAFDAGKSTFRHETFKEYKGKREKTPPELAEQLPVMRDLLKAFNIDHVELTNYEADDIIGTLATQVKGKEDWDVHIYTGDKDLLQLVNGQTTVHLTKKGITNVDTYQVKDIDERYGLKPEQIIDMKGLMGDSSDNIPGVPGVGEKTALKLLKEHGSVEEVYQHLDEVSGKKLKEKLEANEEQALMSKQLATIFLEVPLEIKPDDLKRGEPDQAALSSLFKELEFQSLLSRIGEEEEEKVDMEDLPVTRLSSDNPLENKHLVSPSALYVEMLEENYHQGSIIGVAIANETGIYYVEAEEALTSDVFKKWAEDDQKEIYTFDAKRTVVALGWAGIDLSNTTFDIQMASYLIDPASGSHEIADIANRKNGIQVQTDEAVYGKGKKQAIPEAEELSQHLGRKAAAILDLKKNLEQELRDNRQWELFQDLEMPLSVILGRMEANGVSVDQQELETIGKDLTERLAKLEQQIYEAAGQSFNINSPKQLGKVLFEDLGLPVLKKTKTGYSTSADVLEKLKGEHDVIDHILFYRQLGKLNSTYIEGLLKVIHPKTGKIHTIFNQAVTQTGRLSSTEPNLQNIPVRLEEGRKIRRAFVPSKPGSKLFAADYSQIELRVLAHISKDENLISAFQEGMDIHTKTASDVFGVKGNEVTAEMRRTAKAVNFGIVYGISDYGLSQNLGISRKKAQTFIDKYFESYPGVKTYMEDIVAEAREQGYVTTMLQRRRYLPDLTSRNFNQRSFAERTAMNTPIQGSAADIIKKAMVDMATELERQNLKSVMLLQVHDELIFEVPEDEIETMEKLVKDVMESTIELNVPLITDMATGDTWYDAK
ncbi:DNA polymerase I [Salisediminibacterium selenitireducens]|uniref:DNA polymerase I n=1 Tax=Bacillus selenitireducens (strain ATCC 700615 / DSM 15326 / MLS10) TaxID=439292 RepID=D6XST5_BACIE|nr:DNA polymerase I [Salisediminibacterium selenitireducens]ADH98871.1 DNA polymerase I [[Bacillus] selenitireducens MLS10]